MNALYWNCRGIGNSKTRKAFLHFCRLVQRDFLCLMEPWFGIHSMKQRYWKFIHLNPIRTYFRSNSNPTLQILVTNQVTRVFVVSITNQLISVD